MKHTALTICLPLSDHQNTALTWYCQRATDAEIFTGNPEALADPALYLDKMRATYSAVIGEIVKDWEKAGREGTRADPIWKTAPMAVVPKPNAITLVAG